MSVSTVVAVKDAGQNKHQLTQMDRET